MGRSCLLQPFCDFAIVALVFCYDVSGRGIVSFAKIDFFATMVRSPARCSVRSPAMTRLWYFFL
jgi:hypothetical protein